MVICVQAGLRILGLPLGRNDALFVEKIGFYNVVRHRCKGVELTLAPYDEGQGRRLYAAYRENAPVPLPSGGEGKGTGGVHADEPVGAAPGQSRFLEVQKVPVVAEIGQGFANALLIQGVEENPFDRLFVAYVVEDFIDEELPFPVRVTGVDDAVGFADEFCNDLELVLAVRAYEEFPIRRNNG